METENSTILVKNIDHLGLIAGMIDSLGLVSLIDSVIPSERKVSHGVMVKALILNAMGFCQHALYITPKFFERCPVGHLLGDSYEASDFNDDSIGRCLDALYGYGINKLFVQISYKACEKAGLDTSFWHLDSTNFSLEGEYLHQTEGVKITQGFAKDKRFDLKQVTLGLITHYKSAIPAYMQTFDGNASDKQTLATMIDNFVSCFAQGADIGTFIADAGIYSGDNLNGSLKKINWISRVPETISEAKALIATTQNIDLQPFKEIVGYSYRATTSEYAGVAQRWIVIASDPLAHAVTKTMMTKAHEQIQAMNAKVTQKIAKIYPEKILIDAWMAQLKVKYPFVNITYTLQEVTYYCKAGKPKIEIQRTAYQIDTFALSIDELAMAPIITQKSRFILASNVLNTRELTEEQILKAYKTQATSVENGFKFLKDPIFFAESFFVKKVARIESLLMIMSLSLLVYSLCERNLQQSLAQNNECVATNTTKNTQKPTLRLIFNQFRGIHFVQLNDHKPFCTNLNDNHVKIIKLLGKQVAKYYFLQI